MSPHSIYCALFLFLCRWLIWQQHPITAIGTPLIFVECYTKCKFYSPQNRSICKGRWMARNYSWQLSVHTHFNRKYFFFFFFCRRWPLTQTYQPSYSCHVQIPTSFQQQSQSPLPRHGRAGEPAREILLQLMPGSVELRMNSLQGSGEWQSVKVNNNTWHCCVTVRYFHLAPYGNMSDFTASPADMSVLLAGVHCHCSRVSAWSWDAEKCHLPLASPGRGATSHSLQRELGMLNASLDQTL